MKNILILHGSFSDPYKNWYQYLGQNAKSMGYEVNIPKLQHVDKLNLEETYKFIMENNFINADTVMLGHSSGATYILGILQRLPESLKIKKAILVAGFVDADLTDRLFQEVSKIHYYKLFPKNWEWKKIKERCDKFIIFQAPNDPYVQMRHAEYLKEKLDGDLVIVPGGSHFSENNGGKRFKEFPELLHYL